jgi:hypothetical protein
VTIVANDSESDDRSLYATYLAAFTHSTKRLWITHAYFAPNEELLASMINAAQRGVDVRLIVPSFTDSTSFSRHASDLHPPAEAGVKIYELKDALLHAKSVVIDGTVTIIGSSNLDMRSFLHNDEVNAIVISRDTAQYEWKKCSSATRSGAHRRAQGLGEALAVAADEGVLRPHVLVLDLILAQVYHWVKWYIVASAGRDGNHHRHRRPAAAVRAAHRADQGCRHCWPSEAGDALPSIRQLANDLGLNSKTVAKAYQLLARDSVIETKGYRGTYVHPKAKANCKFNLQEWTLRSSAKRSTSCAKRRDRFGNPQCVRRRHQPATADEVRPSCSKPMHSWRRSRFRSWRRRSCIRPCSSGSFERGTVSCPPNARADVSGCRRRSRSGALSDSVQRAAHDHCSDRLVAAGWLFGYVRRPEWHDGPVKVLITVYFLVAQMVPLASSFGWESGSTQEHKHALPDTKRKAVLERRALFDFISPFAVVVAVVALFSVRRVRVLFRQHPFPGFAGLITLCCVTLIYALIAVVVLCDGVRQRTGIRSIRMPVACTPSVWQ